MPETKHITGATQYATSADFHRIFNEEMEGLYLLSFLLTADHKNAEQCFVSGIEDSIKGNPVFKEWARSWARRVIIQNAIRVINPRLMEKNTASIPDGGGKRRQRSGQRLPRFLHSSRSSVLSISCRFLNATPITIVRFSWGARAWR